LFFSFILGFIQTGEAETVVSSVVKLSEDSAENARMLEKLMKERRYVELNGLKVEPRFPEKPLYTVCHTWLQVTDKKSLNTLKEKPKPRK
jgi:hypothetical protein